MGDSSYVVKRIDFFGRQVKICMQNKNGPCPLLAIANVLSLRNELKLPAGIRDITQSDLITSIVDLLLERSKAFEGSGVHAADYARNVSDVFPVLQKLTTGIDVNVKFHNAHAFEPTPEVAVFDLLGIPLVHGWLVDPQDKQAAAVFGTRSYNELMEVLLAGLDESEVEALSTGPLRNLSISHSSFSQAHQHALEQQQQQQQQRDSQQQQQQQMVPIAEGAVEPLISLQEPQQQQQQVAAAGIDQSLPQLPQIFTSSSNGIASSAPPAVGDSAVDAAVDNAEDAVIEDLVEEMLQYVCCDNMPSRIELGDSPTRSTSLTRKMAFEGAGPSRLGPSSSESKPAVSTAGIQAAATAAAAAAAVPAGDEKQDKQQQQQQGRGAAVADAHVVRGFMEAHCSQLTPYGLTSLADSLKEHQLAVFFRNNHFNALFKYEGSVYLLVTDQGYEAEPDIVWERLDSVNGDTTFCTGAFSAFVPHRDPATLSYSQVAAAGTAAGEAAAMTDLDAAIAASLAAESGGFPEHALQQQQQQQQQLVQAAAGGDHEDADFALALQLQLQEEEEAARAQAQRQQQQQQQQQQGVNVQQQQQQPVAAAGVGLQQQADSLAASVRQMGRRIASGVDRATANLQQQAAQFNTQQGYQQPAMAAAGGVQQHQQHYMQHQQQHRRGSASCGAPGSGAGRRRQQQQEDKCSIM